MRYRYCGTDRDELLLIEPTGHLAGFTQDEQFDAARRLIDEIRSEIIGDVPDPVVLFSGRVELWSDREPPKGALLAGKLQDLAGQAANLIRNRA